jgi:hypothetical protein
MNDFAFDSSNVDVVADIFCALADNTDESFLYEGTASNFIADIWKVDRMTSTRAIEKIIFSVGDRPRIANAFVEAIIDIGSPDFDEVCYLLSKKRACPIMTRMLINSLLLFRHYDKAIKHIDKHVQDSCRAFIDDKLEAYSILTIVKQACIFGRKHLHEDISAMLSTLDKRGGSSPYIDIDKWRFIEVTANCMKQGEQYAKGILEDKRTQRFEKEAAVFSLGCESNPSFFSYFEQAFLEQYQNVSNTTVCNEIIGSIIYSSHEKDVVRFLVNNLKMLRNIKYARKFLNFRRLHTNCITRRLLFGCSLFVSPTTCIADELLLWLDNKERDFQTFAILALEKYGRTFCEYETRLKAQLKSERFFRKNSIMITDLIRLRQCNIYFLKNTDLQNDL